MKKLNLLLFFLFSLQGFSQTYFSKRLNVGGKSNDAYSFKFHNDTFYIPSLVFETGPIAYKSSLLKVDKTGNLISQKRFAPANMNLEGGFDLQIKNNKFYIASTSAYTMQIHAGLYSFDQSCDTIYTKYYGDTTYWNNGCNILPYLKTKDKFLLIGLTDSTCGPPHSGYYKVFVRVVDTNGVLSKTNLYMGTGSSKTVAGADTTLDKGYIISGVQSVTNFVLKLDSNLVQKWVIFLSGMSATTENGIATLKNGEHVLAHCQTDSIGGANYYDRVGITRLDQNGNIKWQKFYGVKQVNIAAFSIKVCSNGDYIVSGLQGIWHSPSAFQNAGYIMRTDSLGNLKWWHNYLPTNPVQDTIATSYLWEVMEMPDKSISAVGYQDGSAYFSTIPQSWLIHVDSMGCLVPGCSPILTNAESELNTELKFNFYPNPSNGKLIIESFSFNKNAEVRITNVLGNEIKEEKLKTEKTELDVSDLSNGIYFLKFYENNKLVSTRKLIKQ